MVNATIGAGLVLLLIIAVVAGVLILRHRLSWRIAIRNARRGRGRTILLLLGLLVGTMIISGSLSVGSTVQNLVVHYTYIGGGNVHEAIYGVAPTSLRPLNYSTFLAIENAAAGYPNIAGITPMVMGTVQLYDQATGVPETSLNLISSNANQSANLGVFTTTAGTTSTGPGPGQAYIDEQTALAINASVGDTLEVFGTTHAVMTLGAIVVDDDRGGYQTAGVVPGNVFVDLAAGQALENLSSKINFIAVTNTGGQIGGIGLSDTVSGFLNSTLATIPSAAGLEVHEPLKDAVASATSSGESIETLFLVLGLFSIAAGAMLIVGIFTMLAEERKGEMGMLRAIGMRRRDLVYVYLFEGLVYGAGSALAGTFLGVVAGYLLTYAFSPLIATGTLTSSVVLQSFTATPSDLVISYVAGFLLTLITVAVASARVSRLNIVAAIRDIPPTPPPTRFYTWLLYLGVVVTLLGAVLLGPNLHGTSDLSIPILGGALIIIGLGLIAARFVRNRFAFTAVGAALLVWAGAEQVHRYVLGNSHTGTIFIVFTEGILMVGGALMLYVFNSDLVTAALLRLARGKTRGAPVARVALSYPSRRPGRTAVTLTIFALVTFAMVSIACVGSTVQSNLGSTIQTQSGGYTFFGESTEPMPNLPQLIANNSTLAPEISIVVPVAAGLIEVNVPGSSPNPYQDTVYAAPGNQSPSSNFYSTNQFGFQSTWNGLSPSQVWDQLEMNASVAVVDGTYVPSSGVTGISSAPHPHLSAGGFIDLSPPESSAVLTVRVIGVLTEVTATGVFLNPGAATHFGYSSEIGYLLTVRPGVSTSTASQDLKRAFFTEGLVLYDITSILQSSIATTEGFIGLLEIFVGLGLAVGIAAMGILALRAVVERRREIGMLRAMGFTEGGILRSFFLEYSFVTLLGLVVGTALGVWIVYDLSISPIAATEGVSNFAFPYVTVPIILLAAYGLAMLAIAAPSIRASRMPPAEAVRPTE
ncbi:MAG: FtsX-like permease family protein [Thermoplasmata archaeon]